MTMSWAKIHSFCKDLMTGQTITILRIEVLFEKNCLFLALKNENGKLVARLGTTIGLGSRAHGDFA